MKFSLIMTATLILSLAALWGGDRPVSDDAVRIAAVGDSITYGYNLSDRSRRSWPAVLELLGEGRFYVENFGNNGATLLSMGDDPYIQTDQYREALNFAPQIVIIALGTNDAKGKNIPFLLDFIVDYRALIQSFFLLESHPQVYICLPPPVSGNLWGVDGEVLQKKIRLLIKEVAFLEAVHLIDLAQPFKNDLQLIPDGVHPGREGAELIASEVYNSIKINSFR